MRKVSQKFTTLNKSTVRTFLKKYREQVKKAEKESRAVSQAIVAERRGMPLMLGLNVVKVGHKYLLPVGNNWNSFVKFRRLPGGHTWHIKRAT